MNDITTYNLEDCFEPEEANQMKQIFEDPTIWHKVKPVEGAQNGLRKLIQGGYQVYLVTNNSPYTYGAKFDWIRRYYPFVESSKIICMKDKWYFNCDLMLEDCLETLIAKPYYEKVASLIEAQGNSDDTDKSRLVTAYEYLAHVSVLQDNNDKALEYCDKALAINPSADIANQIKTALAK